MKLRIALVLVCFLASSACEIRAENWPQFRGVDSAGISRESDVPTVWSTSKNVLWKTEIPGVAWSCPIVWENKVFLTTAVPEGSQEPAKKGLYVGGDRKKPRDSVYQWLVLCLDRDTGKILWKDEVHKSKPSVAIHVKNTYASETPATDGKNVVSYFAGIGVYCHDFTGKVVWKKEDLGSYKTKLGWGYGSSPILDEGTVYIQCDNEEKSFVVALDLATGKEKWRDDRNEKSSWGTPFLWKVDGRKELVTAATGKVRSYDAANGKTLWTLGGMSSISVPTPIASSELLYVSSGYVMDQNRPVFAIKPGAKGDLTLAKGQTSSESIAWFQKQAGAYMPTPILVDGQFYVLRDRGWIDCYDAKTGKEIYSKQRFSATGGTEFTASPIAHKNHIYCLCETGETFVVKAGPKFEVVATNPLEEMCMATPAIADNSLFIRTMGHLYRIKAGGGTSPAAQ